MILVLKKLFWIAYNFLFLGVIACNAQFIKSIHTLRIKGVVFQVDLARTEDEHARGLMEVTDLLDNQGMLFIFEKPENLSFWMKNTPLPLSIAYISEQGEIKEIYELQPFSLKAIPSRYAVLYALEVKQGIFKEKGIEVGDLVEGLPSPNKKYRLNE